MLPYGCENFVIIKTPKGILLGRDLQWVGWLSKWYFNRKPLWPSSLTYKVRSVVFAFARLSYINLLRQTLYRLTFNTRITTIFIITDYFSTFI